MVKELKSDSRDINVIDTLRLFRSENVGIKTFYDLIKIYHNSTQAINAIPELLSRNNIKKFPKIFSVEEAHQELSKVEQYGGQIISIFDDNYPKFLKHIYDPPPVITIYGDIKYLKQRCFSMVGSRNSSANGCRIAYKLAKELGERGFSIVSGLARGIDTAVHRGAIKTGTIAVIAGGIDNIYPPENTLLYQEISQNGLIISELAFGTPPRSQNFPQRNRIISGISEGTLVVEASLKSGSLITAKYALEQNREVFAIPGFPLEPRCHGTNQLIKEGATLVASINDILDILSENSLERVKSEHNDPNDNMTIKNDIVNEEVSDIRKLLVEKLNYNPISIDDIVSVTECSYSTIMMAIIELELAGKLLRHPGNKISLLFEDVR